MGGAYTEAQGGDARAERDPGHEARHVTPPESEAGALLGYPTRDEPQSRVGPASHGRIEFDRLLMSAAPYPADYGYIPDTLGQDGDVLDALVGAWRAGGRGAPFACRAAGLRGQAAGAGRPGAGASGVAA